LGVGVGVAGTGAGAGRDGWTAGATGWLSDRSSGTAVSMAAVTTLPVGFGLSKSLSMKIPKLHSAMRQDTMSASSLVVVWAVAGFCWVFSNFDTHNKG
jgi:hypothetical protein